MLTKNDFQQIAELFKDNLKKEREEIKKVIREEVEAEVGRTRDDIEATIRMSSIRLEEKIHKIEDRLKNIEIKINNMQKDISYIKKTVDVIINHFDREDITIIKRLDKIESNLGLTTAN